MPRKQKAEAEPVTSADNAAAPAPAKKPATPKAKSAKSAAARHKEPAKRGRGTKKKSPETEAAEVVELVAEIPEAEVVESVQVTESPGPSPMVEVLAVEALEFQQHYEPGTPEEREEIARIAYSYYAARNFAPADPLVDWLCAEEEYRSRRLARV
jgi:hypothetical protein